MPRLVWSAVVVCAVGSIAVACGSNNSAFENPPGDLDGGGQPEGSIGFTGNTDASTNSGECRPKTCQDQGIECGPAGDGCGGIIQDCGQCGAGLRCGGPNALSKCVAPTLGDGGVCTPKTCADLGVECGPAGDGCGGILQCGSCLTGFQCGADNAYSKCVSTAPTGADGGACVPIAASTLTTQGICGQQSDGCGGVITGVTCVSPQFCGGGGPSKCGYPAGSGGDGGTCAPKTCADLLASSGINCGVHPDGCGGMTPNCGSCSNGQACGGGGVASQCGGGVVVGGDGGACVPLTSCAQAGKNCGTIANGCGGTLTCTGADGGAASCPSGQTCGGGGTANVCGAPACTPFTKTAVCTNAGKDCGFVSNGCGGVIDCGATCATGICGGGGVPNKCGGGVVLGADGGTCTPQGCGTKNCGQVANGCGGLTTSCGTCTLPGQSCGGGGTANVCGGAGACVARTAADCTTLGLNCGFIADGCGGVVQCGATCASGGICGGSGTANVCSGTPGSCPPGATNYCNQQVNCGAQPTTKVTGRVYAPNGTLPIYDALVWVPKTTAALPTITTGATCDTCSVSVPALVSARTDYKGDFTLDNVPAGNNIPIVIQVGKWRRSTTLNVTQCTTNSMACDTATANGRTACKTRLPRTQGEGGVAANNIPKIAVTSGGADTLQCLLRKIGVADSEFTHPTGTGRINLFAGSGGTSRYSDNFNGYTGTNGGYTGANRIWPGQTDELFDDVNKMRGYDAIVLSCEGNDDNAQGYSPSYAPYRGNMEAYANGGGRVFASHWQHSWLHKSNLAAWQTAATWNHEEDLKEPQDATINMSFTKGDALARWLNNAGSPSPLGTISIDDAQHTIDAVNSSVATSWISIANPIEEDDDSTSASIQYFTMNTPTTAAPAAQCGRIVVSDLHLSPNASDDPPDGVDDVDGSFPTGSCRNTQFPDQQKLLAFMLFDLTSCVQPDLPPSCTPKTCQQQGIECGAAGNGCGGQIAGGCGTCQVPGQICGYGGQANKCGGPSCTPITTCPVGLNCGDIPNGCGGLVHCGDCNVSGQTCGGGGQANKCGAPTCSTKTCAQLGVQCGQSGNGCGGTQSCGNCVPGVSTCGGGGVNGQCGTPACTPKTCAQLGNPCGTLPNGCGGTVTCSSCPNGQVCGGGGAPNVCGSASCSPKSCAQVGAQCGQASDTCGGLTTDCGTCQTGQVCQNNQCITPSCTPTTCQAAGVACGPLADGCGGLIASCGSCPTGQTCGGGGVPGQCGGPTCTARTCAQQGAVCGQVADGCGGLTPNCGSCPGTQTCNNGVCTDTCTPRTCAQANANCGSVADGCGGLLDCGPCVTGTCGGGGVANQCGGGGGIH